MRGEGKTYESERPSRVLIRDSIDEHVGLRGDDSGVDESKEEEAADERAKSKVARVGVLPL